MMGTVSYKSAFSFGLPLNFCAVKDGTLPFDPQKIAEDILEEVQNTHVGYAPGKLSETPPPPCHKVQF